MIMIIIKATTTAAGPALMIGLITN
jgi:hypothetical protein